MPDPRPILSNLDSTLYPSGFAARISYWVAKLQDRVSPFAPVEARRIVEQALGKNIQDVFCSFEKEPLASASIAQVHAAELHTGEKVIVKILRPKITTIIRHDIALLYFVARLVERGWSQGKRLRPVALVAEFETTLSERTLLRQPYAPHLCILHVLRSVLRI